MQNWKISELPHIKDFHCIPATLNLPVGRALSMNAQDYLLSLSSMCQIAPTRRAHLPKIGFLNQGIVHDITLK
jgi:hypothetical protein